MKFYITVEGIQKLKRSFLNLKLYSVISVPDVLAELGYTYSTIDDYGAFIVNQKIMYLINNYAKSKRIRGIIYSNPNMSVEIIENLFDELESEERISDLVLLDDYNIPKLQDYYEYFQEIIFFPSVKKIRLIECSLKFPPTKNPTLQIL
jgi:hypothetical protein